LDRIAQLQGGTEDSQQAVRGLDATHWKLKSANEWYGREKPPIDFPVGSPSGSPLEHCHWQSSDEVIGGDRILSERT
jgi:hypothetical protein